MGVDYGEVRLRSTARGGLFFHDRFGSNEMRMVIVATTTGKCKGQTRVENPSPTLLSRSRCWYPPIGQAAITIGLPGRCRGKASIAFRSLPDRARPSHTAFRLRLAILRTAAAPFGGSQSALVGPGIVRMRGGDAPSCEFAILRTGRAEDCMGARALAPRGRQPTGAYYPPEAPPGGRFRWTSRAARTLT